MTLSQQIPAALELLDYFGIAVFGVSGALLAAEKRQTLVTFIFFAMMSQLISSSRLIYMAVCR